MAYSTIDKSSSFMNTTLYTGNNTGQSITGVGFKPDVIWNKSTSNTEAHNVWDSVRGVHEGLTVNSTGGSSTWTTGVTSFDSDGWTMGSLDSMNDGSVTYASWNWLAGGAPTATGKRRTNDSASETTLTNGTHYSGVSNVKQSVNSTADFSITTFTGAGSSSAGWFESGLSGSADFIWIKRLEGTSHHVIWHKNLTDQDGVMLLNHTNPEDGGAGAGNNWGGGSGDGDPNVGHGQSGNPKIGIGTWDNTGGSTGTYVCYAWKEVAGYSKFGSYVGNANDDGPFIYTGFKPIMFLTTNTVDASNWTLFDSVRDPYNEMTKDITPNTNNAEDTSTSYNDVDFLSNGVKIREDNGDLNASNKKIIYMAFGQTMVGTNNTPATAR